MIYLDLALRGGAATLLLLLAALLWRAPICMEERLSAVALAITKSAFLITTAAMPLDIHPVVHANLMLLTSMVPTTVTWLIVAIFLDAPGRRWPWIVASLATSAAYYVHLVVNTETVWCLPMAVMLYGALFILALWSTRDDLVECRCRARPGFAAAIAGLALFLTLGQSTGVLPENTVLLALLQGAGVLIVALSFAIWLLRPDVARWPGPNEPSPEIIDHMPIQHEAADPALIAHLQTAMAARIWQEEGLTIGALAGKLAVPEHRLRRAINQGLGFRNFSTFINSARIEAARAMLTDPAQMHVTVLEIAYDVGFSSVGPFNRAFRAETGHSPTEFRRLAQDGSFAISEKSSPLVENLH